MPHNDNNNNNAYCFGMSEEKKIEHLFEKVSVDSDLALALRLLESGSVRKACELLSELAQDRDQALRKEALYWLAQARFRAGDTAAARAAIEHSGASDQRTLTLLEELDRNERMNMLVGAGMVATMAVVAAGIAAWFVIKSKR